MNANESRSWTGAIRSFWLKNWPADKILPTAQPAFVSSFAYLFGALSVGGLVALIASGVVLAVAGPSWWQTNSLGLFVNSVHYWSVQLFFIAMTVHLLCVFFTAAWRGNRKLTWVLGALCFGCAVFTAFTGYVSQQDFESQWIATQGKDALNSLGVGAYFNLLNLGQTLTMHVTVMPVVVVVLVGGHLLAVRRRGVVPPFDAREEDLGKPEQK